MLAATATAAPVGVRSRKGRGDKAGGTSSDLTPPGEPEGDDNAPAAAALAAAATPVGLGSRKGCGARRGGAAPTDLTPPGESEGADASESPELPRGGAAGPSQAGGIDAPKRRRGGRAAAGQSQGLGSSDPEGDGASGAKQQGANGLRRSVSLGATGREEGGGPPSPAVTPAGLGSSYPPAGGGASGAKPQEEAAPVPAYRRLRPKMSKAEREELHRFWAERCPHAMYPARHLLISHAEPGAPFSFCFRRPEVMAPIIERLSTLLPSVNMADLLASHPSLASLPTASVAKRLLALSRLCGSPRVSIPEIGAALPALLVEGTLTEPGGIEGRMEQLRAARRVPVSAGADISGAYLPLRRRWRPSDLGVWLFSKNHELSASDACDLLIRGVVECQGSPQKPAW